MFLRIENCFGIKVVNGVKVIEKAGFWWVDGKHFKNYYEALDYVGKRYPLETPEQYKAFVPKPVEEEEEEKPIMDWIPISQVREEYQLTQYERKILKRYYEFYYPDFIKAMPGGAIMKRDLLDKMIRRMRAEFRTGKPIDCPKNFVNMNEYAKMKGIKPQTISAYIKQGVVKSEDIYYAQLTRYKVFLNPELKLHWGK